MFAIRIVYTILPPFKSPLLCLKEMCFKSFSTFPEHNLNALNYSHIPLNSAIQRPLLLTQFILKDAFCTRNWKSEYLPLHSQLETKIFLNHNSKANQTLCPIHFPALGQPKRDDSMYRLIA